ncbi:ornithine carbamoyltransferase [Permianibacter sp. IMCC34836]|uniref:ornithine carbamoyltransferase n=1 Tax=Permianibacter fluminis TaxID=2738515 RepID=UPI0015536FB2|nr:ornithine carbamoyltransferase [Permianibacter fluminis]NQD37432.1 ornithine carbamoyltransferase [Permianibacter fluminis]
MAMHYLTGLEFSPAETESLIDLAIRTKQQPEAFATALKGHSFALLFEKPSLRTRVSFEVGITRLGGHSLYIDHKDERIGVREATKDYAKNLSVWVQGIVARVYQHSTLTDLAQFASVPVVNALCEQLHPCQALADFVTIKEAFGQIKGIRLGYVGDGNNVSHSLLLLGAMLGAQVTVATPAGRGPKAQWVEQAQVLAAAHGGSIKLISKISEMGQQDVLYTDTWLSMGCAGTLAELQPQFAPFQLNETLLVQTGAQYAMHCQPAHRDLEISGAVMDSKLCLALPQAENRLHAQNALLLKLFNKA